MVRTSIMRMPRTWFSYLMTNANATAANKNASISKLVAIIIGFSIVTTEAAVRIVFRT